MSTVSQALSSELGSAQCGSSPVWNRQAPSSSVAAARSVDGSGRPPIARSAITTANVSSVAMTMPMMSFRCVASIEVAVDDIDSTVMQRPDRQVFDVSNRLPPNHRHELARHAPGGPQHHRQPHRLDAQPRGPAVRAELGPGPYPPGITGPPGQVA